MINSQNSIYINSGVFEMGRIQQKQQSPEIIKNIYYWMNRPTSRTQRLSLQTRNLTTSSTRAIHTVQRNNRSVKSLNRYLKEYKYPQNQQPHKGIGSKNNQQVQINEEYTAEAEKGKENKQQKFAIPSKKKNFASRISQLVDDLLLNIEIFKKVFQTSKRKRFVISKLYGWDPIFNGVFFTKIGQHFTQQFKGGVTKQKIIVDLGLDKRTFESQNIYNKLRLFLAQLITANIQHQELESQTQKYKLSNSCFKLRSNIQRLSKQETTRVKTLKQIQIMKQTHLDMLNMKMKIRNRANQLQRLERASGSINVHPFYLKEENNVNEIESFIKGVMKKI